MEIKVGSVVRSRAGHDADDLMFVLALEGERVLLVDGRSRRAENPKRKNPRHLAVVAEVVPGISERLIAGEKVLAAEIRKTLSALAESDEG